MYENKDDDDDDDNDDDVMTNKPATNPQLIQQVNEFRLQSPYCVLCCGWSHYPRA